jgi:hypothetical protein
MTFFCDIRWTLELDGVEIAGANDEGLIYDEYALTWVAFWDLPRTSGHKLAILFDGEEVSSVETLALCLPS